LLNFLCELYYDALIHEHIISLSIISLLIYIISTGSLIIPVLRDTTLCFGGDFFSTIRTIIVFPSSGLSSLTILKVKTLKFFETRKTEKDSHSGRPGSSTMLL